MTQPLFLTDARLSALPGFRHAFFTREGGVSRGIYEGLNVGRGSKDDPAAVAENRRLAAAVFGQTEANLLTCHQIHSPLCLIADAPFGEQRPEADGVASATAGLVLGALSADCAPILIAEPVRGLCAAAHAGWKGALTGVIEATIEALVSLGGARGDMVAAVGPCIAQASYEVGADFEARFLNDDPESAAHFIAGRAADKRQFDLPGYVVSRLKRAGVENSAWIGADTCADPRFFSNRRAFHRGETDYGRLLSAIMLV
jgi:YfiH family protein